MFSETVAPACVVPGGSVLNFSDAEAIPAQGYVTYIAAAVLRNDASGTLINTATVAAPAGVDTNAANNSSTDSDPVGSEADITVTKTASPISAVPGESVVYTLQVTNAGPANVGQRLGDRRRTHQRRLLVGELELRRPGRRRSAARPPPAPATSATPAT